MESFDTAATFNDDYLWFYAPLLTAERNRSEMEEIVELLGLAAGSSILDAPCGYGELGGPSSTTAGVWSPSR